MPGRPFTAAALAAAALGALAPLAQPATITTLREQPGLTRQVAIDARWVAWTRCLGQTGPTEVWAARRGTTTSGPIRGIRAPGACETATLVGVSGDRVVLLLPIGGGLRKLVSVDPTTGVQTLLDTDTPLDDGVRITSADVAGPTVTWLREVGAGNGREADVLQAPADGTQPPHTVYQRSLIYGAVHPVAVWGTAGGAVVVRELLTGAVYGYGIGQEQAVLVDGTRRTALAGMSGGAHIATADFANGWFVYTLVRDGSNKVMVMARNVHTGARRALRTLVLPRTVPVQSPAVPVPTIAGNIAAWRERLRVPGGFRERIVASDLARRKQGAVVLLRDSLGQRLFMSQPAAFTTRVAFATVHLANASGPLGGYLGQAPVGARSGIQVTRLR
ncbi:MAG: hypothetical protein U0Y82_02975 [Thermoleophilia bacterium]